MSGSSKLVKGCQADNMALLPHEGHCSILQLTHMHTQTQMHRY